jgi:flagellar protein FliS
MYQQMQQATGRQVVLARPDEVYKKQSALTATGVDLIIMLYDALKKFMILGRRAIEKGDIQTAHDNLTKSQLIIEELLTSLDMSYPISGELMLLYDYMLDRLKEANLKKEAEPLLEAMPIVDDLRSAWMEISAQNRGNVELGD